MKGKATDMGKTLRRLAVFLAAVVVLQGLALLFFTPAGLEKVFVVPLRLAGEKFRPDTNTYAVYYDARSDVAAADLIVVGMDFAVAESYDVLGHFTRFVKQNNDISDVLMPLTHNQVAIAGNMLKQTDEDRFNKRIRSLKEQTGMTDDCCDYLSEIFYVNSTMSEAKKFGVASYEDKDADTLPERIAAAFAETERGALCAVDGRELTDGFREGLEAAMPGKTVLYMNMYYAENTFSPETHDALVFPLTGSSPACYFFLNRSLEGYYRYYRFVTGLFGHRREDPVDTRFPPSFFVIAGGGEAGAEQSMSMSGAEDGLFGGWDTEERSA